MTTATATGDPAPAVSRKRSADDSAKHTAQLGSSCETDRGADRGAKRARTSAADVRERKDAQDEWDRLSEKLADIEAGRADGNLGDWEKEWDELCELLYQHEKVKETDKNVMKELGAVLKRCAFLEHKLGMRD